MFNDNSIKFKSLANSTLDRSLKQSKAVSTAVEFETSGVSRNGIKLSGNELSEQDLDKLMTFTTPLFAREPREVSIYIEDCLVSYLKKDKYDEVLVLTGSENSDIEDLSIDNVSEFRSNFNYAYLNYNDALQLYSYLIKTFGKDRFGVSSNGALELKISYDEYTTKLREQLHNINFGLRTESFIVNLIYNVRLRFERKAQLRQQKFADKQYSMKMPKDYNLQFQHSEVNCDVSNKADLEIDDNDSLGGSSFFETKKAKLQSMDRLKLASVLFKKKFSYDKAKNLLINFRFKESHMYDILRKMAAVKRSSEFYYIKNKKKEAFFNTSHIKTLDF